MCCKPLPACACCQLHSATNRNADAQWATALIVAVTHHCVKARQDLEECMAVFKSVTHYSMALLKGCPWFICIGIEKSLFKNTLSTHLRHIESKYLKAGPRKLCFSGFLVFLMNTESQGQVSQKRDTESKSDRTV